jgi:DNA-3-methyladenine glycosylase II
VSISARHLRNADLIMSQLVSRFGAPELKPRRLPPFQSLAHAIIHQQLSGAAAGTILKRFNALFDGRALPTPAKVIRLDVERLTQRFSQPASLK